MAWGSRSVPSSLPDTQTHAHKKCYSTRQNRVYNEAFRKNAGQDEESLKRKLMMQVRMKEEEKDNKQGRSIPQHTVPGSDSSLGRSCNAAVRIKYPLRLP